MARKKNASFVGVSIFDTDLNAPSFGRAIENIVGDVALVHDMVTGENGETNVIDRTAEGRGAFLGTPIVNQYIGRDLYITSPATKDTNGGTGETCICYVPIFIPSTFDGSELIVEVFISTDESVITEAQPRVIIEDTSRGSEHEAAMTVRPDIDARDLVLEARVADVAGGRHLLSFRMNTNTVQGVNGDVWLGRLMSWSVYWSGSRPVGVAKRSEDNTAGVTTPAATEGVAHVSFDEAMFDPSNGPPSINGILTADTNRNENGLLEYIPGWPAGGNADYTHEDHDGAGAADASNPARSRFMAHTRSLYANEPEIEFVVWCEAFGAFMADAGKFVVNLAEPPTIGMLNWYAPWPIATASQINRTLRALFPDFQTSSSRLKADVLIGSDSDADVGNWTITIETSAGSAGASPVAVDGTSALWIASISAIPFDPDTLGNINLRTSRSGAKSGIGELCILGVCLYFDPFH